MLSKFNQSQRLLNAMTAFVAVFSFLLLHFLVNPAYHHYLQQISWSEGGLFFKYYFTFAGGPAEYSTLFIAQFFKATWLGSLIIAIIIFGIAILIFKTLALRLENKGILYLLLPLFQIMLLSMVFDYLFPFSVLMNIMAVVFALYICAIIDNKGWFAISFHAVFAGVLIYYFSGGAYFLIFMASYLILYIKKPDSKLIISTLLIIGVTFLVPFVAWKFIFLAPLKQAYFRSAPDVAAMLRYSQPLLFRATLVAIPVIMFLARISAVISQRTEIKITDRKQPVVKKRKKNIPTTTSIRFDIKKLGVPIGIAGMVALSGLMLFKSFNK